MMQWIRPLLFILVGLFAGIIAEKIIFNKLGNIITKKGIPGSEIIFGSLRRIPFTWFVLAGFFGAILSYSLTEDVTTALQKIVIAIFLFTITLVLARLAAGFINLFIQRTEGVPASLISNLIKSIIFLLGALIIFQTIGIEITPIITTLGITGLAVGLALQDTLANLFSGFYLLLSKQVKTGDYIKLESGQEGYITDITWRNINIEELAKNIIIVPNSKLASANFTNYHLPAKQLTLTMNVGVSYDSDLEQVERVTVEVAKEVMQEIALDLVANEPFIRFHTFNDFSIDFTLYMRVGEYFEQRIGKHLFIKKLHKRYKQEGISIPFPIRDIYMKESINLNEIMDQN
ncbi:mechanosensitive ion channel family protein [Rivularia sp. UHCC 0363]|uniref:mechanosensitive ion channel family protein n=1 Tax=Rivularia sp. UHCC 0363 TaxID=3110244 RepID=UPI002B1F1AB2|nr:mechanosensitive ion channel domain-containing protein [Rivularia sp. UHCC 0363]MEA5595405.1 mechanosensitive ion channel domain-containing protein [Rivularia sp. UHCC 0363]